MAELIPEAKAALAKLKHPSSYMEKIRTKIHSDVSGEQREPLEILLWLELRDELKTRLHALEAIFRSTEADLPAPPWAAETLKVIYLGYVRGEIRDLAIAFELKAQKERLR